MILVLSCRFSSRSHNHFDLGSPPLAVCGITITTEVLNVYFTEAGFLEPFSQFCRGKAEPEVVFFGFDPMVLVFFYINNYDLAIGFEHPVKFG